MTNKWANRTKTALAEVSDDLIQVGGGGKKFESIAFYYSLSAPKIENGKTRQLKEGDEVVGTYEGNFKAGQFNKTTHKVKTTEGLVGVPGTGQLDKLLAKVAAGATVKIVYRGLDTIREGQFAGRPVHNFIVRASKLAAE